MDEKQLREETLNYAPMTGAESARPMWVSKIQPLKTISQIFFDAGFDAVEDVLTERVTEKLKAENRRLASVIEIHSNAVDDLERENKNLKSDNSKLREANKGCRRVSDMEAIATLNAENQKLNGELRDLAEENVKLRGDVSVRGRNNADQARWLHKLIKENERLEAESQKLHLDKSNLQVRAASAELRVGQTEAENAALRKSIRDAYDYAYNAKFTSPGF